MLYILLLWNSTEGRVSCLEFWKVSMLLSQIPSKTFLQWATRYTFYRRNYERNLEPPENLKILFLDSVKKKNSRIILPMSLTTLRMTNTITLEIWPWRFTFLHFFIFLLGTLYVKISRTFWILLSSCRVFWF